MRIRLRIREMLKRTADREEPPRVLRAAEDKKDMLSKFVMRFLIPSKLHNNPATRFCK